MIVHKAIIIKSKTINKRVASKNDMAFYFTIINTPDSISQDGNLHSKINYLNVVLVKMANC